MTLLVDAAEAVSTQGYSLLTPEAFFELMLEEHRAEEVHVDGVRYRPHPNGGGLVAITAYVGSNVFVDTHARVEDEAIVVGSVRILDRAIVCGNATLDGRCSLAGDSVVGGYATLTEMVTLRKHARVGGTARLHGGILLDYHAYITRGELFGPLSIG